MNQLVFSLLILVFSISSVFSQTSTFQPLPAKPNWEIWRDKIQSAGSFPLVGVLSSTDEQRFAPPAFYIDLGKSKIDTFCVEIQSLNGAYFARREFKLDQVEKSDFAKIVWPTKRKDRLSKFPRKELTILTYPGACSYSNQTKSFYTTLWNIEQDSLASLTLLFKAPNTPNYIHIEYEDEAKPYRKFCESINSPTAYTFDCKCEIPKEALQGYSKLVFIQKEGSLTKRETLVNLSLSFDESKNKKP